MCKDLLLYTPMEMFHYRAGKCAQAYAAIICMLDMPYGWLVAPIWFSLFSALLVFGMPHVLVFDIIRWINMSDGLNGTARAIIIHSIVFVWAFLVGSLYGRFIVWLFF